MSNVYYREVRPSGPAWQKKAEEHAEAGRSFCVRPFNKQLHWAFLSDLCERHHLAPRFDARERTAYFEPQGSS